MVRTQEDNCVRSEAKSSNCVVSLPSDMANSGSIVCLGKYVYYEAKYLIKTIATRFVGACLGEYNVKEA